jgi:general secretion pathway protein G
MYGNAQIARLRRRYLPTVVLRVRLTTLDSIECMEGPMDSKRFQGGFTLLEVMVVVVILGILAALVVPRIMSRPDQARMIAARQDIASLAQALKLYRLDNQRYPSTEQGLAALVVRPSSAPLAPNWKADGYLERLPRDPWGNPYQYLSPGLRGEIDVFSFGADGAPGGESNDADIGSWAL